MSITFSQMKEHSKKKRLFSKQFGISMRVVQQCIDELITFGEEMNWLFDTDDVLNYASNVNNVLYQLIDWEADLVDKQERANNILTNVSLLIATNSNTAFQINLL